jgi:hypothetical protein
VTRTSAAGESGEEEASGERTTVQRLGEVDLGKRGVVRQMDRPSCEGPGRGCDVGTGGGLACARGLRRMDGRRRTGACETVALAGIGRRGVRRAAELRRTERDLIGGGQAGKKVRGGGGVGVRVGVAAAADARASRCGGADRGARALGDGEAMQSSRERAPR